jgi:hypothetical protein
MEAMAAEARHDREEAISGAIYGTIITAATMSVVSDKRWDEPFLTSAQVLVTLAVFWLAHSFAQGVAVRVTEDDPRPHEMAHDLRASWPMVAAAFPQLAPMVLVGLDVFSYDTGLWIAYGVGVATLAGYGALIARRRRLGTAGTVRLVVVIGILGLILITLKELIH